MGFLATASLALVALGSLVSGSSADEATASLEGYECTHPAYKTHIMSRSPLVIYITDFLTPFEREHLQALAGDSFTHSGVTSSGSAGTTHHSVRTSQSTSVPRDAVVRCIEARALAFQGLDTPAAHLEPLQLVRYAAGEHYHFHTDWFTDAANAGASLGGNRASSFFGYVAARNLTGGGTNFPMLDAPSGEAWCALIDCDEQWDRGVTFRPVEGNVVYWENLLPGGEGDQRTLHAGLPVVTGEKIGINIWTRQAPLSADVRGEEL